MEDKKKTDAVIITEEVFKGSDNKNGKKLQIYIDKREVSTFEQEISEDPYDKPPPCFGCGIGWFSFVLGIAFPPSWYFAAILYLCSYYHRDPRERAGLAASAIAALILSVALGVTALILYIRQKYYYTY